MNVSLDTDSAARSAAQWRQYADDIEAHGRQQQVPLGELQALVGDVYAPYTAAKTEEYAAREAAYLRVAAQARAHADKLDNTRTEFETADEDSAQRFGGVLLW